MAPTQVIFTPLAGDDVNPHAPGNALSGYDPALISGRYKLILGSITQASWTVRCAVLTPTSYQRQLA